MSDTGPFGIEREGDDLKLRIVGDGHLSIRVGEDMSSATFILRPDQAARLRDWLTAALARPDDADELAGATLRCVCGAAWDSATDLGAIPVDVPQPAPDMVALRKWAIEQAASVHPDVRLGAARMLVDFVTGKAPE